MKNKEKKCKHKWRCHRGITSICKRCGMTYTEYYRSLNKRERAEIDLERKRAEEYFKK